MFLQEKSEIDMKIQRTTVGRDEARQISDVGRLPGAVAVARLIKEYYPSCLSATASVLPLLQTPTHTHPLLLTAGVTVETENKRGVGEKKKRERERPSINQRRMTLIPPETLLFL